MEQRDIKKIREKLYDLELPVDTQVWQEIEGTLRRRKFRKLFSYATSAAAVLIAAFFILWPSGESPEEASQQIAQAVQMQENLPDSKTHESAMVATDDSSQPAAEKGCAQGNVPAFAGMKAVAVQGKAGSREVQMRESAAQLVPNDGAAAVSGNKQVMEEKAAQVQQTDSEPEQMDREERKDLEGSSLLEYDRYFAAVGAEDKNEGRRYSVAFSSGVIPGSSASVSNSTIKATSAGAGAISQSYNIEQISDTRYSLPLNLGVQFQFMLKENLALGIGVNYTMLRSRYDCLINKKQFEISQALHYVGVPVNVYGLVTERNRFSFYVNAGAMFEKGIRAVYDLKSYNQSEHSTASIKGVDVSVNAGLGVEYRPGSLVGLYLEPNLVYFINSDVPRSIRTDQPFQVKAELGLRFHF